MNSIEWLKEKLWNEFNFTFSDNIFEQAKEMHKQEIIDAMNEAVDITKDNIQLCSWGEFEGYDIDKIKIEIEQYYNETFKKD